MNQTATEKLLDALWDAYVKPRVDPKIYAADRKIAGLAALEGLRSRALTGDIAERGLVYPDAQIIWNLLTVDAVSWLPKEAHWWRPELGIEGENDLREDLLAALRRSQEASPPTHRDAVDPVSVVLPLSLARSLQDALEALGEGEVLPLVVPVVNKRRERWSWDRERIRAVEQMLFLHGEGVDKAVASRRVAAAMKSVDYSTILSWETGLRPRARRKFEAAFAAGRLAAAMRDDPSGARSGENPADADAVATMDEIRGDPLADFGARYQAKFGARHRSRPVEKGE